MSRIEVRRSGSKLVVALFLLASVVATLPRSAQAQASDGAYICNDRISVHILADGRMTFGAFPNPTTCRPRADGQSYALTPGWPDTATSFSTYRNNAETLPLHTGTLASPPTNTDPSTNVTEWTFGQFGQYAVRQTVQLSTNPLTGLEDAFRITYRLDHFDLQRNTLLGMRLMLDTTIGDDTTVPIVVNDQEVTMETDLAGDLVPERFFATRSGSPMVSGGVLVGQDLTRPDRFVVGLLSRFNEQIYSYQGFGEPMPFDTAVATYWEAIVSPGRNATYVTQFGLGTAAPGPGPETCTPDERTVCGTDGDDVLQARDGIVYGGEGNDTIDLFVDSETQSLTADCGGGNDTLILHIEDLTSEVDVNILCGDGNDKVVVPRQPGSLDPLIRLGDGADVLSSQTAPARARVVGLQAGFTGRYRIFAGLGRDRVTGGLGKDSIDGDAGDDTLNGAAGADRISGDDGGDDIEGGNGNDNLAGGGGGDTLHGGDGANNFAGGPGTDTCLSDTRSDDFTGCERIRRNHRRNHLPL